MPFDFSRKKQNTLEKTKRVVITNLLLLLIATSLLSCNGQGQSELRKHGRGDVATGKVVSTLDDKIWKVFQDSRGHYWFGSKDNGLYHFDGNKLILMTRANGLIANSIRGIQEDKNGNIYIETPEGISKYDGEEFSTLRPIMSLSNKWILTPDDLWFGYNANDVYRYDGESLYTLKLPRQDLKKALGMDNEASLFNRDNSPYAVYGINKDKDGNVWFGTIEAGAFRFDGEAFLWIGEKELSILRDGRTPGVRSMIQDRDGYFWLSNFINKYKLEPSAEKGYEKVKAVDISPDIEKDKIFYFNSGLVDEKGDLWMITYGGGVWIYDGHGLSNMEISNGNEEVLLISIYQDNKKTIWLGTDSDGVYRYNGKAFEKYEPMK
jgi:ligand-binding sensor domain-containing protein